MFIWISQNKIILFTLSHIPIIHYFKVLQASVGAVENTHLIKLNQSITHIDTYPFAKKHLHTLGL